MTSRALESTSAHDSVSVQLAWTSAANVDAAFMVSVLETMKAAPAAGIELSYYAHWSGPALAKARCAMVDQFLAGAAEWLLMVDADMSFTADALPKLLAAADATDAPILSGLYFGADAMTGAIIPEAYREAEWGEMRPIRTWPTDETFEVAAVGTGFLLVHRSVYERMKDEFSRPLVWFEEVSENGIAFEEDLEFCRRARRVGFSVRVHSGVEIAHAKRMFIGAPTWRTSRSEA